MVSWALGKAHERKSKKEMNGLSALIPEAGLTALSTRQQDLTLRPLALGRRYRNFPRRGLSSGARWFNTAQSHPGIQYLR